MADFQGYTTVAIIRGRIPKLVGTADESDKMLDVDVEEYITNAMSIIDGKLSCKYTVPFAYHPDTPKLISTIALMLAMAWIIKDVQENYQDDKVTDPSVIEERALKWLDEILAGTMSIDEDRKDESDTSLQAAGIGIHTTPDKAEDETETETGKQSRFYLPGDEEHIL